MRATSYLGDNVLPRGRKARAILGCLCLAAGARVPRSRIAAMLWDRVPDFQGRASFRQAFRELVVAFGPLADELIVGRSRDGQAQYRRCAGSTRSAVLAPGHAAQNAHRSDLASHCKGELLEELDGLSVIVRSVAVGRAVAASPSGCARCSRQSSSRRTASNPEASERADIARRLIRFDPTHEGASRILMRALADMGERVQALREYARCARS